MQELEGITLSHYFIQRRLARGGMSEIYLAQDIETRQTVAIKLVHASDDDYCERFRREIKALAVLRHEHILPALDYGEYGSWCYLVTPYIAYGTLNDRLLQGSLSVEEAGQILEQLANALQFAHERGVVHRDIKPANVLLRDGQYVYLTDFGLVKRDTEECSLTQSGYLIGTPEYMAPELVECPATITSDIYALGILLYQMLTGRVPFRASTPVATIWKHLQAPPERPSLVNPTLPYAIDQVVLQALAKNPQDRFQTVNELLHAYQQALSSAGRLTQSRVLPSLDEQTLARMAMVRTVVRRHKVQRSITPLVAVVGSGVLCASLLFGLSAYGMGAHIQSASLLNTDASGTIPRIHTVIPTTTPPPGQQGPTTGPSGNTTGASHPQMNIQPKNDNGDSDGNGHGNDDGNGNGHGHKHED